MAIENRGPELEAVGYTLVSVALVSVLLRCYTRVFKVKSFGFDDWCMAFALVSAERSQGESPSANADSLVNISVPSFSLLPAP